MNFPKKEINEIHRQLIEVPEGGTFGGLTHAELEAVIAYAEHANATLAETTKQRDELFFKLRMVAKVLQ